jgi:hypothetical protein
MSGPAIATRPKDFSWFWINTFSRYLGWGSAFDGDQSVKMVIITESRA